MSRISRIVLAASLVFVIVASFLFVRRFFSNQLEKRLIDKDVVPIRLIVRDQDRIETLAQMILFPEQKWVLFYFVNTDARQPEGSKSISERSAMFADNFDRYSGLKSVYSIEMTRETLARLIDLGEGLPMYLETPQIFPNSNFQYPAGRMRFSGAQAAEFAFARRVQAGQEQLSGLERMRRMETILLNVAWNSQQFIDKIRSRELRAFAASLIETDLTKAEVASLLSFLADSSIAILEVPLEQGPDRQLYVKDKRAKTVYAEFFDNLRSGRMKKDQFSLEVLNGTEIGGLARRVKQFLQDRGILVLNADNYPIKPVPKSVILVRAGRTSLGKHVMDMTALPREGVFFDRSTQDVDVTILLGTDFEIKKLQVFE